MEPESRIQKSVMNVLKEMWVLRWATKMSGNVRLVFSATTSNMLGNHWHLDAKSPLKGEPEAGLIYLISWNSLVLIQCLAIFGRVPPGTQPLPKWLPLSSSRLDNCAIARHHISWGSSSQVSLGSHRHLLLSLFCSSLSPLSAFLQWAVNSRGQGSCPLVCTPHNLAHGRCSANIYRLSVCGGNL